MRPIDAVQCADMLSDKLNINIGDLVDLFAEIPTADVVPREEVERIKQETVRKMHDLIKERCIKGGIYPVFVKNTISKVAEEMLEGGNGNDNE